MARQGIECSDYASAQALNLKISAALGYPKRGKVSEQITGGKHGPVSGGDALYACRVDFAVDTKTYFVVTVDDPETQATLTKQGFDPTATKALDVSDAAKVVTINETRIKVAPTQAIAAQPIEEAPIDAKLG